jgi:hypothetical protein
MRKNVARLSLSALPKKTLEGKRLKAETASSPDYR